MLFLQRQMHFNAQNIQVVSHHMTFQDFIKSRTPMHNIHTCTAF